MLAKVRSLLLAVFAVAMASVPSFASEANLVLPDLSSVSFLGGISGSALLTVGLLVCVFGLIFGFVQYKSIKNLPVHKSMLEVSELIYETCKTYLITQGKFIIILEALLAIIIAVYFANTGFSFVKIAIIFWWRWGESNHRPKALEQELLRAQTVLCIPLPGREPSRSGAW